MKSKTAQSTLGIQSRNNVLLIRQRIDFSFRVCSAYLHSCTATKTFLAALSFVLQIFNDRKASPAGNSFHLFINTTQQWAAAFYQDGLFIFFFFFFLHSTTARNRSSVCFPLVRRDGDNRSWFVTE